MQVFSSHNRIWIDFFSLDFITCHATRQIEFAVRKCSTEGFWEDKAGASNNSVGWTNYTDCYWPQIKELLKQLGEEKEVDLFSA